MLKTAVTAAAAAAILLFSAPTSTPARADGWHHHLWSHHHHWGRGGYTIVRWDWGDCKIWHDDGGMPNGTGWLVLRRNYGTWDGAWNKLLRLQAHHQCL